ncbi:MAG TPA: peptidylprolyl isomerase [Rhizomicrobium sp.]|nr:peptidylprolyl isomerase [Rhizomicrobium sp.]
MLARNCVFAGLIAGLALAAWPACRAAAPEAATPGASAPATAQRDALVSPSTASAPAAAAEPVETKPNPNRQNSIVALVNDLPITSWELSQRIALVMSTTSIPRTPEMEKKVRDQVLDQLETEVLQRQEAQKNDITVSSVEVDKYIQNILDDNHMTKEQLTGVLAHGGVKMATFRSQIAASVLWQKAVQDHYAGRITVSPEQVDSEMARIKQGADKAHFTVSEIFLPVDNPDLDDKVRKQAEDLVSQLQAGAQFTAVARQFSQSPSAADGGDIGTVYDGQLAPELNKTLLGMKTGDMSAPIRSIGGYYILLLRQRYEPVGTKIVEDTPTAATLPAVVPLGRILLRLPPKPPKEYMDKVMQIAEQIRQVTTSCDMASKLPEKEPGIVYFALGNTRVADLNQETRDALAKTEPGGVAEPFKSDAGIEIFVRCEKRAPKLQAFPMPTREQVENSLFQEQISALARRYNRDLRRNADIEVR